MGTTNTGRMPPATGIYAKQGTDVKWSAREALPPTERTAYDSAARCHAVLKEDLMRLLADSGSFEAEEDNVIVCAQRIADQCLAGEIPFPYYIGTALAPHVKQAAYSCRHKRWIDRERHANRKKRGGGEPPLSLDAELARHEDGVSLADAVRGSDDLPCCSSAALIAAASDGEEAFAGYLEQAGVPPSIFTRNERLVLHANWKGLLGGNASAVSRALSGRLSHTACRTLLSSATKKIEKVLSRLSICEETAKCLHGDI